MREKKKRLSRSVSYSRYGYYFILPFFIVYAVFSLWPLISTFYYSLFEYTTRNLKETVTYTGLTNYKKLLGFVAGETPYFLKYLGNTVRIWFFNFVDRYRCDSRRVGRLGMAYRRTVRLTEELWSIGCI